LPYNKYGQKAQLSSQALQLHNASLQPQLPKRCRLTPSEADEIQADTYGDEFGCNTDSISHASHELVDLAPPMTDKLSSPNGMSSMTASLTHHD
jgi:hypothetical protein